LSVDRVTLLEKVEDIGVEGIPSLPSIGALDVTVPVRNAGLDGVSARVR